jgi:hypothetical protein
MNSIIRNGIENRGLEDIVFPHDLELSAKALNKADSVMILTGFCVLSAMAGETDGPLGAISLAGALVSIGKKVVIVTDEFSFEQIKMGLKIKMIDIPVERVSKDEESILSKVLINKYSPDHLVSIERTGRAADGNSYSMRGEILSDIIPQFDDFFFEAQKRGIPTTAIGDGGNEIGMGKVEVLKREKIYKGDVIWSETPSDYLIVASVSNWGSHALAAFVGALNGKLLLHDREKEKAVLRAIVNAGSVDGCTRKNEMTVDGLSLEKNLSIIDELRSVAEDNL